MLISIEPA
jgi:hypothetical protein